MNFKNSTGTIYLKPKKENFTKILNDKKKINIPKIVGIVGTALLTAGLIHSNSTENSIKNKINDYLGKVSQTLQIKAVNPSISIEFGQNNFLNNVYKTKELMLQQAAKLYINNNNSWKNYLKMAFILDKIDNPSSNINEIVENMGYYVKHQNEIIGFHSNKEAISAIKNLLDNSKELTTNLKLLEINNRVKNLMRIQNALKKILEELNKEKGKNKEITEPEI